MSYKFKNCIILATDENGNFTVLRHEVLCVKDDKIIYIGPEGEAPACECEKDMKGSILMPGIVDAHCHGPMTLLRGVGGVLILLIVLYTVVGRHLRPLHWLADSAQGIADGDLDTPIADTRREDESGRLQNSLAKMQMALKTYMTDIQQKQAMLSSRNTELKTAYAKVQAYEEKKNVFVRDMTAQMAKPVESLCQQADIICHDAAKMTREEMAQRQLIIMQDTETITQLLDKLMKETAL